MPVWEKEEVDRGQNEMDRKQQTIQTTSLNNLVLLYCISLLNKMTEKQQDAK